MNRRKNNKDEDIEPPDLDISIIKFEEPS